VTEHDEPQMCPLSHRVDPDRPRKSAPSSVLCYGHIQQAYTALEDLPGRYDELGTVAAPTYEQRTGARSAEKPIPYREKAADMRFGSKDSDKQPWEQLGIRPALVSWSMLVMEERELSVGPASSEPRDTAAFLRRHHDWAVSQPWAQDYVAELRDLSSRAWSILNPRGVRRVDVPVPCPICAGPLVALVGQHDAELQRDDLAPPTVQCDGCGEIISFHEAQKAATIDGRFVDWEFAVLWAELTLQRRLSASTLRTWAERGQVQTKRRDKDVLYSLADIYTAMTPERVA
jgi:hypothetical protein